jgi:hypothetical protein
MNNFVTIPAYEKVPTGSEARIFGRDDRRTEENL